MASVSESFFMLEKDLFILRSQCQPSHLNKSLMLAKLSAKSNLYGIWANQFSHNLSVVTSCGLRPWRCQTSPTTAVYTMKYTHVFCALFCCGYIINTEWLIWFTYPYNSGLCWWLWDNHTITPILATESWRIWVKSLITNHNKSRQSMNIATILLDVLYKRNQDWSM